MFVIFLLRIILNDNFSMRANYNKMFPIIVKHRKCSF